MKTIISNGTFILTQNASDDLRLRLAPGRDTLEFRGSLRFLFNNNRDTNEYALHSLPFNKDKIDLSLKGRTREDMGTLVLFKGLEDAAYAVDSLRMKKDTEAYVMRVSHAEAINKLNSGDGVLFERSTLFVRRKIVEIIKAALLDIDRLLEEGEISDDYLDKLINVADYYGKGDDELKKKKLLIAQMRREYYDDAHQSSLPRILFEHDEISFELQTGDFAYHKARLSATLTGKELTIELSPGNYTVISLENGGLKTTCYKRGVETMYLNTAE